MPILADMNFCRFLIDATQDSYGAAGGLTWSHADDVELPWDKMGATVELAQTNYTKQKGKKWQKSSN